MSERSKPTSVVKLKNLESEPIGVVRENRPIPRACSQAKDVVAVVTREIIARHLAFFRKLYNVLKKAKGQDLCWIKTGFFYSSLQ